MNTHIPPTLAGLRWEVDQYDGTATAPVPGFSGAASCEVEARAGRLVVYRLEAFCAAVARSIAAGGGVRGLRADSLLPGESRWVPPGSSVEDLCRICRLLPLRPDRALSTTMKPTSFTPLPEIWIKFLGAPAKFGPFYSIDEAVEFFAERPELPFRLAPTDDSED